MTLRCTQTHTFEERNVFAVRCIDKCGQTFPYTGRKTMSPIGTKIAIT